MMTCTLPICQLCGKEVTHTDSNTRNIFTPQGMQQTFFTITLSCGCVIEFPDFSVNLEDGTQTLKDGFTGQVVLTYFDDEMINDDLYDEDED